MRMVFLLLLACEPKGQPVPDVNNAPGAPVVTLEPPVPVAGVDLLCTLSDAAVDPDGDAVSHDFAWEKNGASYEGAEEEENFSRIASGALVVGDHWMCVVTPSDGELEGATASASGVVRAAYVGWTEGEVSVEEADFIFIGEGIGTQAGRIVGSPGDVDGDGLPDIFINGHQNEAAGFFAGKAFLILASSLDQPGEFPLAEADYGFEGEGEEDLAGHGLDGAGDMDGDGLADLVVSGYLHDGDGWDQGKVYVIPGASLGEPGHHRSLADSPISLRGEADGDRLGHGVCGLGDQDGDGLSEIGTGAYGQDSNGVDSGRGYIVSGDTLGVIGHGNVGDADVILNGEEPGAKAGFLCAGVGDVDGDGLDDALFSAKTHDTQAVDAGRIYLIPGAWLSARSGMNNIGEAPMILEGEGEGDICCVLSSAGDVDGDGRPDLLLGSHYNDAAGRDAGVIYVVLASSTDQGGVLRLEDADTRLLGAYGGDEAGHGIAGVGDLDGDGLGEVLVGSPGATRTWDSEFAGSASLLFGDKLLSQASGSIESASMSFTSDRQFGLVGWGVGVAGDLNGDGVNDLLVGSASEDPDGISRAFLFLTPTEMP